MTHLNITQGSTVETVSASVIKKLYETALTVSEPLEGETDAAYMSGHISVPSTYKEYVDYLAGTVGEGNSGVVTSSRLNAEGRFLDLTIDVTNGYYIPFEDPNMLLYLLNLGIGSNNAVTTTEAALAASVKGSTNTVVTKFNELKYFTNVRSIRSGNSGQAYFRDWTALLEIDLTNVTEVGGLNDLEGGLNRCTALTTVRNASSIILINPSAFLDDSNLVTISGLSGNIPIGAYSFLGCSSLTSSNFLNVYFILGLMRSGSEFADCTSLTSIKLHSGNTSIPDYCFKNCTALTSVLNMLNVTIIGRDSFIHCRNLTTVDTSNVTTTGIDSFNSCTSLTSIDLSSCTSPGSGTFANCTALTTVTLNNTAPVPLWMFANCTALATVTGLDNRTIEVGEASFYDCQNLDFPNVITIHLPDNPSSDQDVHTTFYNCKKLKKVVLTGSNLNIGNAFFKDCTALTEIQGLDKIKYLSGWCICNCPLLTGTLSLPNCVGTGTRNGGTLLPQDTSIFRQLNITGVELPSWNRMFLDRWALFDGGRGFFVNCPNLSYVLIHIPDDGFPNYNNGSNRSVLFEQCPSITTLVINNQTVPNLKNTNKVVEPLDIGGSNVTLYVPDAIVNDYKTATGWSNIASLIKGINELPQS